MRSLARIGWSEGMFLKPQHFQHADLFQDAFGICKDTGATSCGTDGKCDGNGACRKYAVDTVCGAEMCVGGAYTPPPTCNASGQCIPPTSQTCFPYACNGPKCFTSCTQTGGQCGGTGWILSHPA